MRLALGKKGNESRENLSVTRGLDTPFKAANRRQTLPYHHLLPCLVLTEPWPVWSFLFGFVFLYFFSKQAYYSATSMATGVQGKKYLKVRSSHL